MATIKYFRKHFHFFGRRLKPTFDQSTGKMYGFQKLKNYITFRGVELVRVCVWLNGFKAKRDQPIVE